MSTMKKNISTVKPASRQRRAVSHNSTAVPSRYLNVQPRILELDRSPPPSTRRRRSPRLERSSGFNNTIMTSTPYSNLVANMLFSDMSMTLSPDIPSNRETNTDFIYVEYLRASVKETLLDDTIMDNSNQVECLAQDAKIDLENRRNEIFIFEHRCKNAAALGDQSAAIEIMEKELKISLEETNAETLFCLQDLLNVASAKLGVKNVIFECNNNNARKTGDLFDFNKIMLGMIGIPDDASRTASNATSLSRLADVSRGLKEDSDNINKQVEALIKSSLCRVSQSSFDYFT